MDKLETFESNITNNEGLSPTSKAKKRLIKQIRLSFNKLREPIKTTSEFYRIGKMLGKGAFGRVNLAIHKLSEKLVAVKSINK
jgi:serine/threonine protein kinase